MPPSVESNETAVPAVPKLTAAEWDDLIKKLILFIEKFSNVTLYPYQTPIVYSIVESVVRKLGDHKTLIAARQSGKSELMACTIAGLMVILPRLAHVYPQLSDFKKGFWVGVFAPTEEQADTIYNRIVKFLTSEHATELLLDHEIDDTVTSGGTRGKGKVVSLKKCGSLCRMQTCNPKAKIEGRTYHFIFVDEAQGSNETMITKSITPMLVSTRGTMVMGGTAIREKCYFYNAIQHNKRQDAELMGTRGRVNRRLHHEYDWRVAAKFNHNYQAAIDDAKERIGEDSDDFRMSYCVAPDTLILTANLQHLPAMEITSGMKLVGFDEHRAAKGLHRKFCETEVLATDRIMRPCYKITLDNGTVVSSSQEHQWLVFTASSRTEWKATKDITTTDRIFKISDVWSTQHSYESGYLAAAFDGEGHLARNKNGQITGLTFAQKDNAMLCHVRECLHTLGYTFQEYTYAANRGVTHLHLTGGQAAILRFLGEVRPHRLLPKVDVNFLGSIGRHDHKAQNFTHPRVVSIDYLGEQWVIAIKTTSSTYVAEGLASHNCNEWILEKGMFVSPERLDSLYDPSQDIVLEYWDTPVVVGIDVARSNDSTVVTVLFVNWNHPDGLGFYNRYFVLDWLEINDMEWESQYFKIIDFLKKYRVWKVGVDAQGVGGAVAERLALLLPRSFPGVEVVAVSSDSKAQHERWVYLTQLIQRDLLRVPGSAKARERRRWRKFHQQMGDLERLQRGPYMLAAAPEERGAFDDYPDSLAIAASMAIDDTIDNVAVAMSNPFYSR